RPTISTTPHSPFSLLPHSATRDPHSSSTRRSSDLSPSFTVQSDTIILATPPTPASGTVDVTVVTPLGTSPVVSLDHYTYLPPPAFTANTPSPPTLASTAILLTPSSITNVDASTHNT